MQFYSPIEFLGGGCGVGEARSFSSFDIDTFKPNIL